MKLRRNTGRYWLCFLLCATSGMSLVYYTIPFSPVAFTPIRAAIFLVLPIGFVISLFRGRLGSELPAIIAAIGFCAYVIARSLAAHETDSLRAVEEFQRIAFFFFTYFAVYAVSLRLNQDNVRIIITYSALIWSFAGFFTILITYWFNINVWEMLTHYDLPGGQQLIAAHRYEHVVIPRLSGMVADPNLFAYSLLLPILWASARMIGKRPPSFRSTQAHLALLGAFLVLSLSRSGIGIAALAFLGLFTLLQPSLRSWKRFLMLGLIGLVTVQLAGLLLLGENLLGLFWLRTVSTDPGAALLGSRAVRLEAGLAAFLENPLFGVGPDGLVGYLPDTGRYVSEITAHSWHLDILSQYGLIGYGLIWAFFGVLLFRASNSPGSSRRVLGVVCLTWLGAIMVGQLIYSNFWHPVFASQLAAITAVVSRTPIYRSVPA